MRSLTALLAGLGVASSTLAGVAFSRPSSAIRDTFVVKLEWVSNSPRATEQITVRVDDEATATVSRSGRTVRVKPIDQLENKVALELLAEAPNREALATTITLTRGQTVAVHGSTRKEERRTDENLLFVTVD